MLCGYCYDAVSGCILYMGQAVLGNDRASNKRWEPAVSWLLHLWHWHVITQQKLIIMYLFYIIYSLNHQPDRTQTGYSRAKRRVCSCESFNKCLHIACVCVIKLESMRCPSCCGSSCPCRLLRRLREWGSCCEAGGSQWWRRCWWLCRILLLVGSVTKLMKWTQ